MEKLVYSFSYRGSTYQVYHDDDAQEFFSFINGERVGFGSFNFDFESDLKYLIDFSLDTIHDFGSGAILTWFDNGGQRDIKLVFSNRVLKIWLVIDPNKIKINSLISEAKGILKKLYPKTF